MRTKCTHERCPKCGGEIELGYGLAFGGYGSYQWCEAPGCCWFVKDQECAECECVNGHYGDCSEVESSTPPAGDGQGAPTETTPGAVK